MDQLTHEVEGALLEGLRCGRSVGRPQVVIRLESALKLLGAATAELAGLSADIAGPARRKLALAANANQLRPPNLIEALTKFADDIERQADEIGRHVRHIEERL